MEPGTYISHPEFKTGKVIARIGDKKVDAIFEIGGRKLIQVGAIEVLTTVPADKIWRLRDNGERLAVTIERARLTSPAVAMALEAFLSDLASAIPEDLWEAVPNDPPHTDTATLYLRTPSTRKHRRIAFIGLQEKPARIVVAVIDSTRLPKELWPSFAVRRDGYYTHDYLRSEILEERLSLMPTMLAAMQAIVRPNARESHPAT